MESCHTSSSIPSVRERPYLVWNRTIAPTVATAEASPRAADGIRTRKTRVLSTGCAPTSSPPHGGIGRFRSGTDGVTFHHAEPLHHDTHDCGAHNPAMHRNYSVVKERSVEESNLDLNDHWCSKPAPGPSPVVHSKFSAESRGVEPQPHRGGPGFRDRCQDHPRLYSPNFQRRKWDSNPRSPSGDSRFPTGCTRPLCDSSIGP